MKKLFYYSLFILFFSTQLISNAPTWKFETVLENYVKGRKEFPEATFSPLQKYIKQESSVLNYGCRTGIETRQLSHLGFGAVVGIDSEEKLLQVARLASHPNITYVRAEFDKLPFKGSSFDCITTFYESKNLCQQSALKEAKRLLKPSGALFFVHRESSEKDPMRKGLETILHEVLGSLPASDGKSFTPPQSTLSAAGFHLAHESHFKVKEYYTKEEALNYLQSLKIWISAKKMATNDQQTLMLKKIGHHLDQLICDGVIEREITINTYLAKSEIYYK